MTSVKDLRSHTSISGNSASGLKATCLIHTKDPEIINQINRNICLCDLVSQIELPGENPREIPIYEYELSKDIWKSIKEAIATKREG